MTMPDFRSVGLFLLVTALTAAPTFAATAGQASFSGMVTAFDGKYDLHVQNADGNIREIHLHRGTIISPTGLTLQAGMQVRILGIEDGAVVDAAEVETPYHAIASVSPYAPYSGSLSVGLKDPYGYVGPQQWLHHRSWW
ncbi:MAG TPA: hypothetical protein VGZ00_07645 [Candidatus Baltobacteraceae bacterium]|jgi:hypothetical protein|nr:hypothetical protein [Candidatus Baltobacteraceae bacterium]